MLRFDGSLMGALGRGGLGITLAVGELSPFLHISLPLRVCDSLRAEVCGLTLGALLLSTLPPAIVHIEGDN